MGITLPSGKVFVIDRLRSEGPLSAEELAYCRANGVPLAFDPVQLGHVPLAAVDDISPGAAILRASSPKRVDRPHAPIASASRPSSGHYVMRSWCAEDADAYVRLLDDPVVWKHLPEAYPGPITRDLATSLIDIANEDSHHLVLAVAHAGEIIGQARLVFERAGADRSHGEISYWIGRDHWSKGHASAMLPLFIQRCFKAYPSLSVLTARVHKDNPASAKVLARAGFHMAAGPHEGWRFFELARPGGQRRVGAALAGVNLSAGTFIPDRARACGGQSRPSASAGIASRP